MQTLAHDLKRAIRDVPDFPEVGEIFQDVTPVLADATLFNAVVEQIAGLLEDRSIDAVISPGNRGFMIGAPVAVRLGVPFVPVRKDGELPGETITIDERLGDRRVSLVIQRGALRPGSRVAIVDDVVATGTTARAVAQLVEHLGAEPVMVCAVMEMDFLHGSQRLAPLPVHALTTFSQD